MFSTEDAELVGYFAITIKPITINSEPFSNTAKRKLARVSELNGQNHTYNLAAYLIAQTEEVEVKIPAFLAVSVFDVSQTDGEPIPELEAKELLATVEGYEDFIKAVTYVSPVSISFEDIPGDSKGYFRPAENRIGVQETVLAKTIQIF